MIIITVFLALVYASLQPKSAAAYSVSQNQNLGYPYAQMPCEHYPYNVSGYCANYDWGPTHTQTYDHPSEYSNRSYTYRNCTDYVAWKLSTKAVGVPRGLGNAADWYEHVASSQRLSRAKVWSVAVRPGGFGHVAFVEAVNSTGSNAASDIITVSEYNFYGLGTGSIRTGRVSELGFSAFIDFGAHPPVVVPKPAPKPTPPSPSAPPKQVPSASTPTLLKPATVITASSTVVKSAEIPINVQNPKPKSCVYKTDVRHTPCQIIRKYVSQNIFYQPSDKDWMLIVKGRPAGHLRRYFHKTRREVVQYVQQHAQANQSTAVKICPGKFGHPGCVNISAATNKITNL